MNLKLKRKMGLGMFDLLKGAILILVVHRHCFLNAPISATWIGRIGYSVLMPALFLVSGYWLNRRDVRTGIASAVRSLLVPFLIVAAIVVGVGAVHRALTGNMRNWVELYLAPTVLVMSRGGKITYMWFVFSLFIAWCIFYVAVNLLSERGQIIAACLSAIAGGLLMPLRLPFQISQGLIAFFYVYAGYQIKRRKLLERQLSPFALAALLAVWAAGLCFGSLEFSDYAVRNFALSVPGGLCGAYLLVRLFLRLNSLEWRILDPIRWVGRYSMWILCIHSVEAAILPWTAFFRIVRPDAPLGTSLCFALRWIVIALACRALIAWKQRRIARSRVA